MKNNQPTAQVAVNKSVLKLYDGKHVYLSDNQEFGIELFNPTTKNIAAEVYLNDSRAFGSLLVLRPGQRMFLECNPETKRKFKFETYKVEGDNEQVKAAIKNNGKVEVRFYNEKTPPIIYPTYTPPTMCYPCYTPTIYGGTAYPTLGNNFSVGNTSTINSGSVTTAATSNNASFTSSVNTDNFGFVADQELKTRGFAPQGVNSMKRFKTTIDKPKEVETGRIEAGSTSGQKFDVVSMEFDPWAFHTTSVLILPHSQMPVEATAPRNYCVGCGLRNRNEWKFCPKCGRNFNS